MKQEIDPTVVGELNVSILIMNRTMRQRINKEMQGLNNTVTQMDLADTY